LTAMIFSCNKMKCWEDGLIQRISGGANRSNLDMEI
jgi:hypothetical protein